jgi:hypothetical protein
MKRLFIFAVLILTFSAPNLMADDLNLFELDIDKVNMELAQLEDLDQYLNENTEATFATLKLQNHALVSKVSNQANINPNMARDRHVLNVPSWIWGCLFSFAGVAVVYLVTDSKKETKEALGSACIVLLLYYIYALTIEVSAGGGLGGCIY